MISKSYMLRLPSTLFSCQSWEYIYFLKLEMIFMDEYRSEDIYLEEIMKTNILDHHYIYELYAKMTIGFIFEITCRSWEYIYFFGPDIILMDKNSSGYVYLEEVVKTKIP